jgi:arylesterase/paraoxonase
MRVPLLAGVFALLVLVAGGAIGYTLLSFNQFSEVENRFAGSCSPVTGVAGPADIETYGAVGRAFVASLDRRQDGARGAIYSISIDDPLASENWRDRTNGAPAAFRPLGLSFYEEGETRRLFVVNGATKSVEIFAVNAEGDLKHLETIVERRLTSPNDVVAIGPRSFYVTNDVDAGRASLLGKIEFLTRAATGKVFYFDGVAMRLAADGLRFANGVAASGDGARLFVAETTGPSLRIFDRDLETGVLTLSRVETLPAAPDNLNIAWDGALWIAAQPKPLLTTIAERNEQLAAPSLVLRYVDKVGVAAPMTEIFANKGDLISTASVAAVAGRRVLIGALFDEKYLICELPG